MIRFGKIEVDENKHSAWGINPLRAFAERRANAGAVKVSMEITAPLYWWDDFFETYNHLVKTVESGRQIMSTIYQKEFDTSDFSCENLTDEAITSYINPSSILISIVRCLNEIRRLYLATHEKMYLRQIAQLLPSSYNQKRTVVMSYEVCERIVIEKSQNSMSEWNELCDVIHDLQFFDEVLLTNIIEK